MAQNKKSFIAYSDWKDTFDALPDDKAGLLIKHIFAYVNDEKPITTDILVNAVFQNIKNTLKRDLLKWDKQYKQRVLAGQKSAEVRKRNATTVNERSISSTVSVSDSVNVSDSDIITIDIYPSFNDFWNLYDKKQDKPKSLAKWNKLTQSVKEQIINYIPNYKLSQPDKQFRKNPTTFLNNESWNNEIITTPKIDKDEKRKQFEQITDAITNGTFDQIGQ